MPKNRRGEVRSEYRGMTRNELYRTAALDHSDNGRCWWIAVKIQERLALDESQKRRLCRIRKQKIANKTEESVTLA